MKVKHVMTPVFETLKGGEMVAMAAQTMKRLGVTCMVVTDQKQVTGILTDKNIIDNSTALGLDPTKTPVREVMTRGEIRCGEEQDVADVRKKMDQMNAHLMVVLDSSEKPSGMVSHEQLT